METDSCCKEHEDILLWDTFIEKHIPNSNVWTYIPDNSIDIDPGVRVVDPAWYKSYSVGYQHDAHMLCVGDVGSGKTNFINNIIANLTRKYSPQDLRLWLIDCKGNEFSLYAKTEKFPHMLPHIDTCGCTNGNMDIVGALFTGIFNVIKERSNFLSSNSHKTIMAWNEKCRNEDRLSDILPRIVVIADEFPLAFDNSDDLTSNSLILTMIRHILKLSYSTGMHLLFTSQSLSELKTFEVWDQFTLRFGLRCSTQVSKEIMGSELSSSIKESNGYLFVRCKEDANPLEAKKYRIPYISENRFREHIIDMENRAKSLSSYNQRQPVMYKA